MSTIPSATRQFHKTAYSAIDPSSPHLSTKSRSVFITGGGGTKGIGAATAHAFAQAGSTEICIIGRNEAALLTTKASIESAYKATRVTAIVADVTSKESLDAAFAAFTAVAGKVSILVSNAGHLPDFGTVAQSDSKDWLESFNVHLAGGYNLIRSFEAVAAEEDEQDVTVVNLSSALVHIPGPNCSSYAISKLASAKLFEYVSSEHPAWTVVNVHPGIVRTAMAEKAEKAGIAYDYDDVNLAASFIVWTASKEARFLDGRFVWANWDVEELKAMKDDILERNRFTVGLLGWP